jgi:hypothetical protein
MPSRSGNIIIAYKSDVTTTMPVTHDALQDRPSLIDIRRLVCKPPHTGVAVCDDGCQRLIDLMSDGRCHLAHGHHLRDAREISPRRAQRLLRTFPLLDRTDAVTSYARPPARSPQSATRACVRQVVNST